MPPLAPETPSRSEAPARGASTIHCDLRFASGAFGFQSCDGARAMAAVARSRPFSRPRFASVVAGMNLDLFHTLHIATRVARGESAAEA